MIIVFTDNQIMDTFEAEGIRGEFVLLLHGADPAPPEERGIDWAVERVAQLEADGISQKDAIKQAAKEAGLSKRDVYNFIVQNK